MGVPPKTTKSDEIPRIRSGEFRVQIQNKFVRHVKMKFKIQSIPNFNSNLSIQFIDSKQFIQKTMKIIQKFKIWKIWSNPMNTHKSIKFEISSKNIEFSMIPKYPLAWIRLQINENTWKTYKILEMYKYPQNMTRIQKSYKTTQIPHIEFGTPNTDPQIQTPKYGPQIQTPKTDPQKQTPKYRPQNRPRNCTPQFGPPILDLNK